MSKEKFLPLLLLILVVSLINFSSAIEIRFTGQQNTNITISETCSFGDSPCSNSFNCNITIENPSQIIIILDEPMTRNNTVYSLQLNSSDTLTLGIYEVKRIYCTDGTNNGTSNFFFQITTSGSKPLESAEGSTLFAIFIILIVATLFFLVLGIFAKNTPFKLFFVSLSILFMIGTLGFGVTVMQQLFGAFSSIVAGYGIFYRLLIILSVAGGIGLIVYLVVVALNSFNKNRGLIE